MRIDIPGLKAHGIHNYVPCYLSSAFFHHSGCLEITSHLIVRKIPAFGVCFFSPYITSLVEKYSRVQPRERPGQNRNHLNRLHGASSVGSPSLGFVLLSLVHLGGKKKTTQRDPIPSNEEPESSLSCHTVYRSKRQEAFPWSCIPKSQESSVKFQKVPEA